MCACCVPVSKPMVANDCNSSISGIPGSSFTESFNFMYSKASMPVDVNGPLPSASCNIGLPENRLNYIREIMFTYIGCVMPIYMA